MASASQDVPPRHPSWRKRHPVLARALLYGLGMSLGGLALVLLAGRREQDREDQLAYLWKRLETLPIVIQADPDAAEAVKVLDAEYASATLPAALRARAERLRGIIARNRKDKAGVQAAFERALALDPGAEESVRIELALCLVDAGDPVEATRHVMTLKPASTTLRVWAELARSQALLDQPDGMIRRQELVAFVHGLPAPLPVEPPVWLGLAEWTPAGAALECVRWLVRLSAPESQEALELWRRLAALAPTDFEALLAATEGLLAAEDLDGARGLWARATAASPEAAGKALALRSALAPLRSR